MKKRIIIGLILIVIHQMMLPKINSILLMELMGLALYCYVWARFIKDRTFARQKRDHFLTKNYDRPKAHKPWREYRSKTEVIPKDWVDRYEESLKRQG